MQISKLLEPIAGEDGAGSDVRYDPAFDALQSEVEKLTCPSFVGLVDWEGVVELASDILAKKSKDLVVTSYLAVGLIHTRRDEGVVAALHLYHDMLLKFWDQLYPPKNKTRGRILSVEWWLDKTLKALQGGQVALSEAQGAVALEIVAKIEALLAERLPGAPSLAPLCRYLADARPPAKTPPAEGSVPHPPSATAPPSQERPAVRPEVAEGLEERDVEGALATVRRCALLLREEEPANPLGYRLLRGSVWSAVSALPPALEGRTRIASPEHQQAALLRELRQKRSAQHLLQAAEARLPQFIFWLDLNRFSCEALVHLGGEYAAAREAIVQETAHLVRRLPGLVELSFCDGTPFADTETRRWLAECGCAEPRATVEVLPPQGTEAEEGALKQAVEEAQRLAREAGLAEAVALLHDGMQGRRSGRERLLWRLALVDFLVSAGSPRVALPQLEQVIREVDQHGLDSYEPCLTVSALKLAYLALRSQKEPALQEKATEILFRIGRLDAAEMVRLEEGGEVC